jgi:hypothetical protein
VPTTTTYNCPTCCGVPTTCCGGVGLPATLTVTVNTKTGSCACFPNSFTITWDAAHGQWNTPFVGGTCPSNTDFALFCSGSTCGGMLIGSNHCGFFNTSPSAGCSCSPLNLVFPSQAFTGCCTGNLAFTITP